MSKKIKFVNLHAHTGYSIGDGMGAPAKHFDYAISNDLDAHAITDHGNMSAMAQGHFAEQKLRKAGKNFKYIKGIEAYYIPSQSDWNQLKQNIKDEAEEAQTKIKDIEDDETGTIVENESETKSGFKDKKKQLRKRSHLILLAKNNKGLENLNRLTSKSYQGDRFYFYPRMDSSLLRKHSEGLIATQACIGGLINQAGLWDYVNGINGVTEGQVIDNMINISEEMNSIFHGNFFLELQWNAIPEQHLSNQISIKVSEKTGIPLISTADCHYPNPKLWKEREVYKKLAQLSKTKDFTLDDIPDSINDMKYQLFPKNGQQMFDAFEYYSQKCNVKYNTDLILKSIERTHDIAHNLIGDVQPNTKINLPNCFTPKGMTSDQYLRQLCEAGIRAKELHHKSNYVERMNFELDVISKRNISDYFILMTEVRKIADRSQCPSTGRGSVAGSLCAYLIGLTQVDPIKFGLYFERFLDVDGNDYPDIDTDFEDPGEIHDIVSKEWKEQYNLDVVQISNFNTFKLKNLVKDLAKLENIPFQEINDVTNKVFAEATKPAKIKHDIETGMYQPNFEDAMEFSPSFKEFIKKYPTVGQYIETLSGERRNNSSHAAGRAIELDLEGRLPLITLKGSLRTPFTEGQALRELEPMGILKYDWLGLATLRTIHNCIELILKDKFKRQPTMSEVLQFYNDNLQIDKINLNDQKVYETIFHEGKWIGIFQFSARSAQQFCQKVKPNNIIELSNITSVMRPGPLAANVDKLYLEKNESIIDPVVLKLFKETRGHLIYQEQITQAAKEIAGMTLAQGNKLRKLIVKRGIDKSQLDEYKVKFIEGGKKNGHKISTLEALWKNFERSSQYLFVKAHSVSYILTTYQTAWLATYYPNEWCCSFLQKEPEDRKEQAIAIVKSYGFEFGQLDINESDPFQWTLKNGQIIPPLQSIKGLGESAINVIIENRPFNDLDSIVNNPNIEYRKLNKRGLDVLCRSGCLDQFIDSRFTGQKHLWATIQIFDRKSKKKKFDDFIEETKEIGQFTKKEILENKVELTGVYPIELIVDKKVMMTLNNKGIPPISEYDPDLMVAWCVPREIIHKKTGKGKDYYIVKVTDMNSGLHEIKAWSVNPQDDQIYLDRIYAIKLRYDDTWGFSTNGGLSQWRMLG